MPRPENEILADLYMVVAELEGPENIAGDGEYPREQVNATYARLNAQRDALYQELWDGYGRQEPAFDLWVFDWADTPEGRETLGDRR